jgi:hypothetical protein
LLPLGVEEVLRKEVVAEAEVPLKAQQLELWKLKI